MQPPLAAPGASSNPLMGSVLRGSPGGGKSTCSAAGPPPHLAHLLGSTFSGQWRVWPSALGLVAPFPTAVSPWPATLRGTTVRRLERGRATSPAIVRWAAQRVPRRAPPVVLPGTVASALTPPMHNAEAPAAAVTLLASILQQPQPPAASARAQS